MTRKYHVVLSDEAELDIDGVFGWFAQEGALDAGTRWMQHLFDAIATLEQFPTRCPIISSHVHGPMYQLVFGKRRGQYLIHFIIEHKTVFIVHIRHAAQDRKEL